MKIRSNVMAPLDLGGDLLRLLPGDNEVKPEVWAKVKDRRITRALLDSGELVVVEAPKAPEPPKDDKPKGN